MAGTLSTPHDIPMYFLVMKLIVLSGYGVERTNLDICNS